MTARIWKTIDGNEAAASTAFRLSEVITIYPITPSSPMGELSDEWSVYGRKNIWETVPQVTEMQSEAGAAGAVHGSLQAGALTTTFTSSQGLLLMIPNMYKIAGELTAFAMHVAARTVATHALSIFGDHSDVMACRQTGFAMLASGSVQEAHDLACIAHAAALRSRVPFLHFFDGFRTSHEVNKIEQLADDDLRAMIAEGLVSAHRQRALSPDHPVLRGTAQNPDTFFQAREAANPFYLQCPGLVQDAMDCFAGLTGRAYHLFDYVGHREAERVIVLMGSGAEVVHETVAWMAAKGEKVGLVKVRLYRPFYAQGLLAALPETVKVVGVLDRTKEPGAAGEPLYLDVLAALCEAGGRRPKVVGGRYGLSSKDFNPAMVAAVFTELAKERPANHFTIGINDDLTRTSIPYDPELDIEPENVIRAMFFGLGMDGTVGANKNSIKIIGEETENYAQGYFVYDSKKAGSMTISHLRFGPNPIRSSYLIRRAGFVACHQFAFLEKYDVLRHAAEGSVFLLNAPYRADQVWDRLPREAQEQIIAKRLRFYGINAYDVAAATGMGRRINTIMQTCFFALAGILPSREEAIAKIKASIEKTYAKKGSEVVRKNFQAVDHTLANLYEVKVPPQATAARSRTPFIADNAPTFVKRIEGTMMAGRGDEIPVSALPADGTFPLSTSRWEKRNIALEIPIWDPAVCIQCAKCAFVCPHATIRIKVYDPEYLQDAPPGFRSAEARGREFKGQRCTVQVAPEDCTGCRLCVVTCPAKDKSDPRHKAINMEPQAPARERERAYWSYFLEIPNFDRTQVKADVRGSQLLQPLFEFPGACAGCGETQYIRLMTQLFGNRALISNATGCSSIYGGNLPTTPYCTDDHGRGPAWSNSLFEDSAEFGLGMRLAVDKHREQAVTLLKLLSGRIEPALIDAILSADQGTEEGIARQRERVAELRTRLETIDAPEAVRLNGLAEYLVRKSVWIVGGDGWAYDIGYGGLDHVISLVRDINLLVLDTQVYSNTGGQQSKATPLAATAKFAAAGKSMPKKDLGLMAMTYGNVYVAQVAFGARDRHTVQALVEAESYSGASLVIAYAHCIAHGYDLAYGGEQQKLAVESGYWPLYRFDPRRKAAGLPPLQIDSDPPKIPLSDYMYLETRYRMLEHLNPERARKLDERAQKEVDQKFSIYRQLADLQV